MRVWIWLMTALLAGLLYLLVAGDGGLLGLLEQAEEIQRLREENEKLAERNRILSAELEELRSGLEGIEGLARDRLGLIREGEKFYQLAGPGASDGPPRAGAPEPEPERP